MLLQSFGFLVTAVQIGYIPTLIIFLIKEALEPPVSYQLKGGNRQFYFFPIKS